MPTKPTLESFFEEVCRDIKQFKGTTERIAEDMSDPARRQRVESLLRDFQRAFARVEEAVPRALTALNERHAAGMDKLQECAAKAKALREKLEELKKANAPQKAAKPAPVIDPNHGAILRQEVLERFGTPPAPSPAVPVSGDVASMSSAKWAARSTSEESLAVPGPNPEKRPATARRDEVTDMSSGVWDQDEPK
jgi:hypothetical protein